MRSFLQNAYFKAEVRGKENPNITAWFFNEYVKNISLSPILREAKALSKQWENIDILVYPQELIVGSIYATEIAGFHYGDGVFVDDKRLSSYVKENQLDFCEYSKNANLIKSCIYKNPYATDLKDTIYTKDELKSIYSTAASSTWFGGHLSMDYDTILEIGLDGYSEKILMAQADKPEKAEYYEALMTILGGFKSLINRTAQQCEKLGAEQTNLALAKNMNDAAAALFHICNQPPRTFHEALQLVTMVHIASNSDSFGRFDKYLYPFFQADIDSGKITIDEALDLLLSLVIKIEQQEQIQNMTIGGILPNGSLNYTDLTRLMLKATKMMGYKGPNLCLRVTNDMPIEFWQTVTKCMESGQGLPAIYNDDIIIKALISDGYEAELARDYCLGGCSQIMFGGRCQFVNDIGMMNIAKIVELTLHNGRDFLHDNLQISPKTGENFTTFEEFYQAFLEQMEYFIKLEASINNKDILDRSEKEGYAFRSLFTRGCINSGKGVYQGGALYNNVQLECIGITNAADSLYAIKKFVFEEKEITLTKLVEILDSNFQGDGANVRLKLRNIEKFGNDCDAVDSIRADITNRLYSELRKLDGAFGGHYIPGEVIFTAHEHCGYAVAATPDGRFAQEVLADSAGSSQGMDMNGPTALMNSLLKLKLDNIITSVVLNMKFHRNFFSENQDVIIALFKSYFLGGGEQLQVNVCDNEELKQAIIYPEKYQNLVVRVGGYSDYFVRLNRRLQDEIILRNSSVM